LNRIYHPWWTWECYKNGFYSKNIPDHYLDIEDAKQDYADFLRDCKKFDSVIDEVFCFWKFSCDQFLSNPNMNRVAWLGQASACYHLGLPSFCRSGFKYLSENDQKEANETAKIKLDLWIRQKENQLS